MFLRYPDPVVCHTDLCSVQSFSAPDDHTSALIVVLDRILTDIIDHLIQDLPDSTVNDLLALYAYLNTARICLRRQAAYDLSAKPIQFHVFFFQFHRLLIQLR